MELPLRPWGLTGHSGGAELEIEIGVRQMRKASKFRMKPVTGFSLDGLCLSREAAIGYIQQQVDTLDLDGQALRLIELFNIDAEELAEAGMAYEQLKAIERQLLF
jgi:hypothetical protein